MADEKLPSQSIAPNHPLQTAAELAKALAWPVLAVLLLVSFWTPLHTLMNTVPQLLSSSEEVSIGGATFHLRKSFVDQAPPEVKEILGDLGPEEVQIILEVKPQDVVCFAYPPPPLEKRPYTVLINLHLFEEATPEQKKEQQSEGYPCGFGVSATPKFARVRGFMIQALSEAIQQSKMLPVSKPSTITKTGRAGAEQ
jgi:hypothetical protein